VSPKGENADGKASGSKREGWFKERRMEIIAEVMQLIRSKNS